MLLGDSRLVRHLAGLDGGPLLDIGCGTMPYRDSAPSVHDWDGLDLHRRTPDVRYEASMTDMAEVPDGQYQYALCSEVLEHVPQPTVALSEAYRILQPGGQLILTVPFLSRLHEEPHDYFRYTQYGLRTMLEEAGFEVDTIEATTSLAGFLAHQLSSVIIAATWPIPVLRWVGFGLNAAFITAPARLMDRLILGFTTKFPANYFVAATKPAG